MIILQVIEKIRMKHGIQFRKISIEEKGKNFLDRYAAYAITNVRKLMMTNLKRNAPTKTNSNGKRVKKNISFNPAVHVKTEKMDNVEQDTMNMEIIRRNCIDQETSTITMEKSKDDVKLLILDVFTKYFDNGGKTLGSKEDFFQVWNTEVEVDENNSTEMTDMVVFANTNMPSLPLQDESSQVTMTTSENYGTLPQATHSIATIDDDEQGKECDTEVEVYEGTEECGNCELVQYDCATHNGLSILKQFGPGMKCIGKGCSKTLLQCLNEGQSETRGAFVCKRCQERSCRQMKCKFCYFQGQDSDNKRTSRKRQV